MRRILICSYLEPHFIDRIRAISDELEVIYRPDLIASPRYPADHVGGPLMRTEAQQAEWEGLLASAEILFDFDRSDIHALPRRAPNVRWIQASSAGIGQAVRKYGLDAMDTIFTTASGVHARPLAEFVMMVMLQHTKRSLLAQEQQEARVWQRFATDELGGKTLAIVGYGNIGKEVGLLARAFGVRVIGCKRRTSGATAGSLGLDKLFSHDELHEMLPEADFVCLITPHTSETEGLIGGRELALMKQGSVLINISRGEIVHEDALLEALESGHLAHAYLDVMIDEPLPAGSPFWAHRSVTIYPHSASTSERENERLTTLFCENLARYLQGEPLLNQLDTERLY